MNRRFALGLIGAALAAPGPADAQEAAMRQAGDCDWTFLADTVMGGVSQGQARIETAAGVTFVRLTGTVSTANRGGFVQVRTALPDGMPTGMTGLRIRVRGDGQRYFIHLRQDGLRPWQFWQAGFDSGADWRDIVLPLADFGARGTGLSGPPKPRAIRSLGLAAYGRDHRADVALAAFGPV